jgi:hypothetical protein
MIRALTRLDLDGQLCMVPGCTASTHNHGGLVLRAFCHPRADSIVIYANGVLTIRCGKCNRHIVHVGVAETEPAQVVLQ